MAIFKGKTVSSILAAFQKTIDDLGKLEEDKRLEVEQHQDVINKASLAKAEAQSEAEKAAAVSFKISQLITE